MRNMVTDKIPRHVAIIMDGNGRWAQRQGLPRFRGHETGVQRAEEIIRVAPDYGVKYLTMYAFSKENWKRPENEVKFLMELLSQYLDRKLKDFMQNNVVFNAIGRLEELPPKIYEKLLRNMKETRNNTKLVATFALNYSSRLEITDACRKMAEEAVAGKLKPEDISEETLSRRLYTAALPDADLLIRTSGEMRLSNFLLWQISYAELYVTDTLWPEFTQEEFAKALQAFQKRERRFGRTGPVI